MMSNGNDVSFCCDPSSEMFAQDSGMSSTNDAFDRMFTCEAFHDLTLVGTDKKRVRVNRSAISSRCLVFEKMLLGAFKEARSSEVPLGYSGAIIQCVVEYLHKEKFSINSATINDSISDLLSLLEASIYFDLPPLSRQAFDRLQETVEKNPCAAIDMLEYYLSRYVSTVPEQVKELALSTLCLIRIQKPNDRLFVEKLSISTIKEILEDDNSSLSEIELFQLLQQWTSCNNHQRRINDELKQLIDLIGIDKISAFHLKTIVEKSGFVPKEQFDKAYASAIRYKHSWLFGFSRRCLTKKNFWRNGFDRDLKGDSVSTFLDVVPITNGIYQWTIRIIRRETHIYLGIGIRTDNSTCIEEKNCWYYDYDGATRDSEVQTLNSLPRYGTGSKLTFEFHSGTGRLTVMIDDGSTFLVHYLGENKIRSLNTENREGFVPIASMYGRTSEHRNHIRLLEYKRIDC